MGEIKYIGGKLGVIKYVGGKLMVIKYIGGKLGVVKYVGGKLGVIKCVGGNYVSIRAWHWFFLEYSGMGIMYQSDRGTGFFLDIGCILY